MVKIIVVGAKGGVGTSTVAAMMARNISAQENKIVKLTQLYDDDMCGLLGVPPQTDGIYFSKGNVLNQSPIQSLPNPAPDVEIVDGGKLSDTRSLQADRVVVVARNDYLSLRALVKRKDFLGDFSVVLVEELHRALSAKDVRECVNARVDTVPCAPEIARAIDAGLLLARPLKQLKDLR